MTPYEALVRMCMLRVLLRFRWVVGEGYTNITALKTANAITISFRFLGFTVDRYWAVQGETGLVYYRLAVIDY